MHLLTHEPTHVLQNRQAEMVTGGTEVGGVAVSAPSDSRGEKEAVAHEVSRVEAAPEVDGPGDALSQLASRWSVEIAAMSGDAGANEGVSAESVLASGSGSLEAGAVTAQRRTPTGGDEKEEPSARYKTMPDGSKLEIHADGNGNFYLRGPNGEKVACDEGGEPSPGAEDKLAAEVCEEEEPAEEICEEEAEEEEKTEEEAVEEEKAEPEGEGEGDAEVLGEGGDGSASAPPGSGGPSDFPALSEGPLAPYVQEKSWHESWVASGSQEGSLSMDGGDKGLVLNALFVQQRAWSMVPRH